MTGLSLKFAEWQDMVATGSQQLSSPKNLHPVVMCIRAVARHVSWMVGTTVPTIVLISVVCL